MKKNFLLLATLYLLTVQSIALAEQKRNKPLSEEESVKFLIQKVKSDSLYPWANFDCLNILVEEVTNSYVDVAIREKHEGKCPGDPNNSPVVDRFRVLRSIKKVLWYEFTEGEYVAYDRDKAWRKK